MNWRERTPQEGGGKGGAERKGPSSGAEILSLVLKAPSEDTEKSSRASTGSDSSIYKEQGSASSCHLQLESLATQTCKAVITQQQSQHAVKVG